MKLFLSCLLFGLHTQGSAKIYTFDFVWVETKGVFTPHPGSASGEETHKFV